VGPGGLGSADEAGWRLFTEGLVKAGREHQVETEIIDLFPRRPPQGGYQQGSRRDVARLSARLRSGNFDLVLWPLGLTGPEFFDVVPLNAQTRFVFLDYCCVKDPTLGGAPNATAITLHGDQAAHLAGYLSGLIEARRPLSTGDRHTVSIIVGDHEFPQEQGWEQGFAAAHGGEFRSSCEARDRRPACTTRFVTSLVQSASSGTSRAGRRPRRMPRVIAVGP
jgi:hypothetical protein